MAHHLKQWIRSNGMRQYQFAASIGVRPHTITGYIVRGIIPSKPIMQRIYAATNGEIDANSFYDLPDLPQNEGRHLKAAAEDTP